MPIQFLPCARWFGVRQFSRSARVKHVFRAAEILEDRTLLTAYVVDTLEDVVAVDGKLSLREAINAASSDAAVNEAAAGEGGDVIDTITFDASLAGGTITLGGSRLWASGKMSIQGLGVDQLAVSGGGLTQVFIINALSDVTISDLTIRDGNADGNVFGTRNGGAIYNIGKLTLTSVNVVENRTAYSGGAIYNARSLQINGGRISGNVAAEGGAICAGLQDSWTNLENVTVADNTSHESAAIDNRGSFMATNCTFLENDGVLGGAINNSGGWMTIFGGSFVGNTAVTGGAIKNDNGISVWDTTFSHNSASSLGGAIYSSDWAGINNSLFFANVSGGSGGAICIDDTLSNPTLNMFNSTLSGNSAVGDGGGLYVGRGTSTITNVTFAGNRADSDGNGDGSGGGVKAWVFSTHLHNTIVAGNFRGTGGEANDVNGYLSLSLNNLIGDATTMSGLSNGSLGNIIGIDWTTVLDPILRDNGGLTKTHALIANSAAINAGSNFQLPPAGYFGWDQRGIGYPRVSMNRVDIGAFEVVNSAPIARTAKLSVDENSPRLAGNLLTYIEDSEGDELEVIAVEGTSSNVGQTIILASSAQLLVNADGSFIYDPAGAYSHLKVGETAVETFRYTVSDGFGGTAVATVEILVYGATKVVGSDINPATTDVANAQSDSDIGIGANGHVVIAWTHTTSAGDTDVRFRRYDAEGNALDAADRVVSVQTSGIEDSPTVAVAADGSFVIGYRLTDGGGDSDVVFDLYNSAGDFIRRVELFDAEGNTQSALDVALSPTGNIIAVWEEQRSGNDDVLVQLFDAQGISLADLFALADESTGSPETTPAVAVDRFGIFVVAYSTQSGIAVQRFSASGAALGTRLLLSPPSFQPGDVLGAPQVGRAADGSFVVAYRVTPAAGSPYGYWHLFNADGSLRAQEATSPGSVVTSVSMDAIGNFVLGTSRTTLDGDLQAEAIFFNSAGERGETAVVNQDPSGTQSETQVAISHGSLAASYLDSSGAGDVEFSLIRQRRSQFGVARPNAGGGLTFFLDSNGDGLFGPGDAVFNFGLAGDIIVVGDWNGDGIADFGVARSNGSGGLTFFLDSNGNREFDAGDLVFNFGLVGDIIVVGDWNGDGIAELGVARRNAGGGLTFFLDSNGSWGFDGNDAVFNFGLFGDIIVVGDWNGDGIADLGVARRNGSGGLSFSLDSNGSWGFDDGDAVFNFGLEQDRIIVGDWNGDGADALGVVRPNGSGGQRVYRDVNENFGFDLTDSLFASDFGLPDDLLLAGAWR